MASLVRIKKPAYTKDTNIYGIDNIPKVYIPLPELYTLTVEKGAHISAGQSLGVALGREVPILSSVSGIVAGILNLGDREYIEIHNDEKYKLCPSIKPCGQRLSQMKVEDIIERIRLCAIPDWKALSESAGKAKRFALNCLDSDPYSFDKKCAVANYAKEIVGGAKIVLKVLGLRLCEIIEDRKNTDEINLLVDCIGDSKFFDIIDIDLKYPMGEAEHIIAHLPENEDLRDDELFVIDAHTAAAIFRAFSQGMPYIKRLVSIGGTAAGVCGCYELPLGTPVKYIAERCTEPLKKSEFTAVTGGVMNGTAADELEGFIGCDTHSIAFIKNTDLCIKQSDCIGCTRCDRACPEGLLPSVFISEQEKNYAHAIYASGMDRCTDCGACSYVCPAGIPICEVARGEADTRLPDGRQRTYKKKKSPFIKHPENVRSVNSDFLLTLFMLLAWSVFCHGPRALLIAFISVATSVLCELVYNALTKNGTRGILNLGSAVCGLLGALTLSVDVPLYAPAITAFFSVIILRGAFGGGGKNLFHSAFGARVLASLIFHDAFVYAPRNYTTFDYIIGNTEGALGETSVILLCAVFIYLALRKIISAIIPALTLSTFWAVSFLVAPAASTADYARTMLIGTGIIFVSVYCSTEYQTAPKSTLGKVAYGALVGALAALIGRFTSYEGAYISAIAASALTPLFNRFYTAAQAPLYAEGEEYEEPKAEDAAEEANENAEQDTEHLEEAEKAEEAAPAYLFITEEENGEEAELGSELAYETFENLRPAILRNETSEDESENEQEPDTEEIADGDDESESKKDFSQTMEFSDAKADELLELLAKEIGLGYDKKSENDK